MSLEGITERPPLIESSSSRPREGRSSSDPRRSRPECIEIVPHVADLIANSIATHVLSSPHQCHPARNEQPVPQCPDDERRQSYIRRLQERVALVTDASACVPPSELSLRVPGSCREVPRSSVTPKSRCATPDDAIAPRSLADARTTEVPSESVRESRRADVVMDLRDRWAGFLSGGYGATHWRIGLLFAQILFRSGLRSNVRAFDLQSAAQRSRARDATCRSGLRTARRRRSREIHHESISMTAR